jgi:hypothetical protein
VLVVVVVGGVVEWSVVLRQCFFDLWAIAV